METSANKVLNFVIGKHEASEKKPVKLGNVNFWHPVPGFPAGLCYDVSVNLWNAKSIQNDLNAFFDTDEKWKELVDFLDQ